MTITSKDPEFITPEIKYLLRGRNAAMRQSRNEVPAALTSRISSLIAKQNTTLLGHTNRVSRNRVFPELTYPRGYCRLFLSSSISHLVESQPLDKKFQP